MSKAKNELLEAIQAVGMSDRSFEKAAGLPQAWVSKLRSGQLGSAKAAASIAKACAFLERKGVKVPEQFRGVGEAKGTPLPVDLAAAVDAARTLAELDDVLRRVTGAMMRGELDRFLATALVEVLRERRQLAKVEEDRKVKNAGRGEPVTVKLVWVDEVGEPFDWRRADSEEEASS